jgi:tetratricopeptide (TPR) repeat protein
LRAAKDKLEGAPESRTLTEAFIREHLKYGRFDVARRAAEDFVKLDPDYAPARNLLAYAAVVDGDHETARKMLDVMTEATPRDASAHAMSARSFEVVGDTVRACAHYRALSELAPDLEEAKNRANACWSEINGSPAEKVTEEEGKPGQLEIEVTCDEGVRPQDCPSPLAIAPDGSVLAPWTPGTGRSTRRAITFVKLRTGDYRILVLGGAPSARGKLILRGRYENQSFRFESGGMHTIATTNVTFW